MTYREDFFRMLDGKTPIADVPLNKMTFDPAAPPQGVASIMTLERGGFGPVPGSDKDAWGVPQQIDDFGTGYMPASGQHILKDVTKWRDIIHAPYDYDYDWAAGAEHDLAVQKFDPETQISSMFGAGGAYFLQMAGFMGFEGAMLAMYDEPEAVHELLNYLCEYDLWVVEHILKYYPMIDVMGIGDDNATEINPFISYDMFKEFLLPYYKRVADLLKENGKIVSYHNCGRCEDFMDDMVDIGVQVWNCATPVNDLMAFKAKYDNKIILEFAPRFYIGSTHEEIKQQVHDLIDTYAPGGAFVWVGGAATMNPEIGAQLEGWIYDEVEAYGKGFYA